MLAVNYSTLRNNLKAYCDKATDESETVIVTCYYEFGKIQQSAGKSVPDAKPEKLSAHFARD